MVCKGSGSRRRSKGQGRGRWVVAEEGRVRTAEGRCASFVRFISKQNSYARASKSNVGGVPDPREVVRGGYVAVAAGPVVPQHPQLRQPNSRRRPRTRLVLHLVREGGNQRIYAVPQRKPTFTRLLWSLPAPNRPFVRAEAGNTRQSLLARTRAQALLNRLQVFKGRTPCSAAVTALVWL